jgi:hypothetical protein
MDSVWESRGRQEIERFRTRLNRTRGLGRMSHEDYEELHKLTNQIIHKLDEMERKHNV